jgi:hypothetical protein
MNCQRSRELLSDYIEETLPPPVLTELQAHLETCHECRALTESLREVVAALAAFREPEPPSDLTERILERTRPVLRAAQGRRLDRAAAPSFWWSATNWLAAAAVLAGVLVWRPPEFVAGASRHVSQTAYQAYSFGVRTYHRTERWLEELNVLRMTVGVAFENRLDRLSERLRDLEEARRRTGGGQDQDTRSELGSAPLRAGLRPSGFGPARRSGAEAAGSANRPTRSFL